VDATPGRAATGSMAWASTPVGTWISREVLAARSESADAAFFAAKANRDDALVLLRAQVAEAFFRWFRPTSSL
jgi:outer membrane protein TolC